MDPDGSTGPYPEPRLDLVFQIEVRLGAIRELGVIDNMRRRIVPIVGGTVTGPRLTGAVCAGGADWQGVRPGDGLTRVLARYWIETSDGAIVAVENAGIRSAAPEIVQRLMAGQAVAPDAYYFRTTPQFEAGEGPHAWLNETVFIGVGVRLPDRVVIRVYAVA